MIALRSPAASVAVGLAVLAISAGSALAISQSGEQKDISGSGHTTCKAVRLTTRIS